MTKGKIIGKIFAVITGLLLISVFIAYTYIDGQRRTLERYVTSLARGNSADYLTTTGSEPPADFKENVRSLFKATGSFDKLEENDLIGVDVKITGRNYIAPDQWELSADIYYFKGDMNMKWDRDTFLLTFSGGKWRVEAGGELL